MDTRIYLSQYPLLALLTPTQVASWLAEAQGVDFATGETIFQEGTAGSWIYLILQGRVRVLRRTKGEREVSLGTFGPGEIFGEYILVPPHKNTATCRAMSAARLLQMPLRSLRGFLDHLAPVRSQVKNWIRLHFLLRHLRGQSFLGFMSAGSALAFLGALQAHHCRDGRTIQAEGFADDQWFFLENGQVELVAAEGKPGRLLKAGDFFGQRALWPGGQLPQVIARGDVCCCSLHRDAFVQGPHAAASVRQQTLKSSWFAKRTTYHWVGQQQAADCGLAALAMIIQNSGRERAANLLSANLPLPAHGLNLLELKQIAQALGFQAHAVHIEPDRLADVALPVIAHQADGHYVVLFDHSPNGVVIGDPATGIITMAEKMFRQTWSGHLLLIAPRQHTL